MRYAPLVVLAAVLVTASASGLAQTGSPSEGTVVGNPTLETVATENRLTWGDDQQLTVTISNDGSLLRGGPERFESRVTTARNLRVEVATERLDSRLARGLDFRQESALVGQLERGTATPIELSLGVRDRLTPSTYQLPLQLSYEYTALIRYGRGDPIYTERTTTRLVTVPLVVEDSPRLAVSPAPSPPLSAGEAGSFSLTLTNTGSQTAADIGLTLTADAPIFFADGRSHRASVFVAELQPGENTTLTVPAGAQATATPSTYLLRVSASYTTPGGFERTSDDLRLGLPVVVGNATNGTPSLNMP